MERASRGADAGAECRLGAPETNRGADVNGTAVEEGGKKTALKLFLAVVDAAESLLVKYCGLREVGRYACASRASRATCHRHAPWRAIYAGLTRGCFPDFAPQTTTTDPRSGSFWLEKVRQLKAVRSAVSPPFCLEPHSQLPFGLSGAAMCVCGDGDDDDGGFIYCQGGATEGFEYTDAGHFLRLGNRHRNARMSVLAAEDYYYWSCDDRAAGDPEEERVPPRWQHTIVRAAGSCWLFGGETGDVDEDRRVGPNHQKQTLLPGLWRLDFRHVASLPTSFRGGASFNAPMPQWRRVQGHADSDACASTAGHSCHVIQGDARCGDSSKTTTTTCLLLFFGGRRATGRCVDLLRSFDVGSRVWRDRVPATGPAPAPRWCHSAAHVNTTGGGDVAFFGGWDPVARHFFDDLHVLLLRRGGGGGDDHLFGGWTLTWTRLDLGDGARPAPRCQAPCFALPSAAPDARGALLVLGGACHDADADEEISYGSLVNDLSDAWYVDLDTAVCTEVTCTGLFNFRGGCNATLACGDPATPTRLLCGGMFSNPGDFAPTFHAAVAQLRSRSPRASEAFPTLGAPSNVLPQAAEKMDAENIRMRQDQHDQPGHRPGDGDMPNPPAAADHASESSPEPPRDLLSSLFI